MKARTKVDWHRADIKAALEKSGWSLRQIALENGLSENTIAKALSIRYPRAQMLIARAIGVAPELIWPSRYGADAPKRGRPPLRGSVGGRVP